jgi:hypothetical protein
MNFRRILFIAFLVMAATLTEAQVTCSPGVCVSPNLPVFTNPGASTTPNVANSNISQQANGTIAVSAPLTITGQGPWLDVTAYGAVPNCNPNFLGCADQTAKIQAAIDACAAFTVTNKNPSGCTVFFPMGNGANNGAYYIKGSAGIGLKLLRTVGSTPLNGVKLVGECSAPGSGVVKSGTMSTNPLNCTSLVTDQAIDMLVVGNSATTFGLTIENLSFLDASSGTAKGAMRLTNVGDFNLTNVACSNFTNLTAGAGNGYCILLDGDVETQYGVVVNPSISATVHPVQTMGAGGVSEVNFYGGALDCNNPGTGQTLPNSIGMDFGYTAQSSTSANGENGVWGTHIFNCATGLALYNTSVTQWQGVMENTIATGSVGVKIDAIAATPQLGGGNLIGGSINNFETGIAIGLLGGTSGSGVPFDTRITANITPNTTNGIALKIAPASLSTALISTPENYGSGIGTQAGTGIASGSQFGSDLTLFTQTASFPTATPRSLLTTIANSGSAPTNSTIAKLSSGTSPATVVNTLTSDTQGAIGIVVNNGANPGSGTKYSQIATVGQAKCTFDNGTTVGDYVTISSFTAGDCHDYGAGYPPAGQVIGVVLTTNGSAGTYPVSLFGPGQVAPAPPLRSSVTLTDDFFSAGTTSGAFGELDWTTGGTTTPANIVGVADHPGLLQLSTATPVTGISVIYLGTSTTAAQPLVTLSSKAWRAVFIFAQDPSTGGASTHMSIRFGFADNPNGTPPTNGIFFQNVSVAGAGTWNGFTKAAASSSSSGGGTTLNTAFNTFEIRNDGLDNIMFLINWDTVREHCLYDRSDRRHATLLPDH